MDLKTLRLASIALSKELLDQFVAYQRTLLAELARSQQADWSGRFAFAHGRALAASRLDLVTLGKVKAAVGEFCGRRSAALEVQTKLAGLSPGDPKAAAVRERAQKELPRLERLDDLEARYGKDAVALLQGRESELVALHRDLARAEGGQGHLHTPG
ncbi:MAG: hypothetical protein AB1938_16025 [Myxococcota bacterium]